ncbi:Uncharacterized protein BM_BM1308 [Brugia malayi]|uniref:Bm1308 n=1 Tax=Brugia malayi TaxID=6279 RepID=A0A1U7F0Y8_BRUMA|nr:Uncharacterized protein BM_BM1308 [Brugia malayi]CDP95580.1 Bm1308 [Brugia malayi]VIO94523.1 Uncharacterized protein BM_BM1308 [Brugia malayi]
MTAAEQMAKANMSTMITKMDEVDRTVKDGQRDDAMPANSDMIVIQ